MNFYRSGDHIFDQLAREESSEGEQSEEDYDDKSSLNPQSSRRIESRKNEKNYQSTNLITCGQASLADITLEELSNEEIEEQAEDFIARLDERSFQCEVINPSMKLKECRQLGQVETLVDYDEVMVLTQKALELQMKQKAVMNVPQP